MSAEIRDYLPLIVIPPSQENCLQNKVHTPMPSLDLQDSVLPGNMLEPESNTLWEKGTFIDIYA